MTDDVLALIGFGEAGQCFVRAGDWTSALVYDRLTGIAAQRAAKLADYAAAGIQGCETLAEAVADVPLILSLVTADQALAVARAAACHIAPGTLYCDMNSVAPATKAQAAELIEAAGGHYVDVAIMAPVYPGRLAVPLLLSGGAADKARDKLAAVGFTHLGLVGTAVGRASTIKMIRSVVVKGMEALTTECILAAERAGVTDALLASLGGDWAQRADYGLERMMVHGLRRAAEMEEAVKTLDALGSGSVMTRGTVERQRAIGALGLHQPAEGLAAKIAQIEAGASAP